jgi:hypothetical protein
MRTMTTPNRQPTAHPSSRHPQRLLALIALAGALAIAGCGAADSLAGPIWHWAAQPETESTGAAPATYTVEFLADGTVKVAADCITVTGTYTVGVPLDLDIDLAPPALADCGGQSVGVAYLEDLGRVSSYATDGGELKLFFADDAGGMRFTPAS